MLETAAFKLFFSILLGGVIGLERESGAAGDTRGSAGGIRTFALVGLVGSIAGLMYGAGQQLAFGFIASIFFVLLASYYVLGSLHTQQFGLTNELSLLITFIFGMLISTNLLPLNLIIAVFVVVILILAFKQKSKVLIGGITRHELEAFISYAIIALVILPFLPNDSYTLGQLSFLKDTGIDFGRFAELEILNPRKLWFVVVLVTGIDVFGYLLSKFVGSKRGFTLASFFAGFISSTSATISLAQKSKRTSAFKYLVGAAILANMASFIQVFLLVGPLNGRWLVSMVPTLLIIIAVSTLLSLAYLGRVNAAAENSDDEQLKNKKIFSLLPALKFAFLIIFVKFLTRLCLVLFGQSGFVLSSIIASFAGIDAILVNLADLAGKTISLKFALITFVLVNATNLLSKSVYSFMQGSRKFAVHFLAASIVIILSSGIGVLLVK